MEGCRNSSTSVLEPCVRDKARSCAQSTNSLRQFPYCPDIGLGLLIIMGPNDYQSTSG